VREGGLRAGGGIPFVNQKNTMRRLAITTRSAGERKRSEGGARGTELSEAISPT